MCLLHYNKKEKNIKVTKSKRFNKPSKNVDTYIYIYIYYKVKRMWVASDKMKRRNQIGFTMIELLAVLVILGIIMVIAVPSVVSYLQGARSDYYDQLEESVKTVGQEYFSDHRSLMPRENGQIFSVNIQDLITEGYTTEILDSDGNDTCTGNVYVKRLATADFEYHACIQCGKTDAEGNQEYISTSAFCTNGTTGNNPDGECDKVKDNPTDDCFMIQIPNSFKVPQCTTVEESARLQGISLEGIVLNNGEDIGDRVPADTTGVDYKKYGNYKIYYTYKQVLNPAGDKYNTNVTVYDDKAPSEPVITMHTDSENGAVYNCTSASNCSWTGKDVYITFTATDKSDCGTEGSGVKEFLYRYGTSGNWQSVGATKTTQNGQFVYKATVVRSTTYDGSIQVKAVDSAKSTGASNNLEGAVTGAYLMVDKTPPTCTSSGGNSNWINASSNPGTRVITGTCNDPHSGCKGNVSKTYSADINSTKESPGTVYDNVGNFTVCPANQTVRIDKTSPSCSSTANRGTVTGTCSDNLSGCKQRTIIKTFTTNGNFSPGSVADNAGNTFMCPTIKVTVITTPIGKTWEYGYTGNYQTFTVPDDGNYQLEVWGSEGVGDTHRDYLSTVDIGIKPGKGGYVSGKVWLNKGTQLTIAVGGQATDFNGGTNSTSLSPGTTCAGGGGGATDMRLGNQRIIVAGGGGGSAGCDADGQDCKPTYGGDGGASNSGNLGPSSNGQGTGGTINTGNGLMGSYPCGGGGGGGYYGGSGGNGYVTAAVGGSSFFDTSYGTKISEQAGVRVGSGYAKITYLGL